MTEAPRLSPSPEFRFRRNGFISWGDPISEEEVEYGESEPLVDEFNLRQLLDRELPMAWTDLARADAEVLLEWVAQFGPLHSVLPDWLSPTGPVLPADSPAAQHGLAHSRRDPEKLVNHIADVVLLLRAAKTLTKHWIAEVEDGDTDDCWDGWPTGFVGRGTSARQRFDDHLHLGLLQYRGGVAGSRFGEPLLDLYGASCLQLHNQVLEVARHGVPLSRCRECGRAFLRQPIKAGSERPKRRTKGLMYCSTECAVRYGQRRIRQRKREQRESI